MILYAVDAINKDGGRTTLHVFRVWQDAQKCVERCNAPMQDGGVSAATLLQVQLEINSLEVR